MRRNLCYPYRKRIIYEHNATIGMALEFNGSNLHAMNSSTTTFSDRLSRMEHWFDRHFGWFFTNGMKERAQMDRVRSRPGGT